MLYDITVCDRFCPIGLDKRPLFSWKLPKYENMVQHSYRIVVNNDEEVVWDSKINNSSQSIYIEYAGAELLPMTNYSVKVSVWDNNGYIHEGETTFETGLLNEENFKCHWICDSKPESEKVVLFSKKIDITKEIISARYYGTSLGVYELLIDGKKAHDSFLAPGWTSYENRIQYQTYDISDYLNKGEHIIGIKVASGWYAGYLNGDGKKEFYGSSLAARGMVVITYKDGEREFIPTDESFNVSFCETLKSDIYHGEKVDFTQDDFSKRSVEIFSFMQKEPIIVAQESEPVRGVERIFAKKLIHSPKGELIIDFGQNLAGIVEVELPDIGKNTQTNYIVIRHAETLDKDGNFYTKNLRSAKACDEYIYGKSMVGAKVYPHFTYHGFRYIAIDGIDANEYSDEKVFLKKFTAIALHTDMKEIGAFSCDNELVNRLQQNILWGQRSNFVDIPTDCPQRDERLGWTGDAAIFCETGSYNYNTKLFFEKWINDVAIETDDEHGVPHLVPSIVGKAVGTAVWSDCATIIPWQMYMSYGDKNQLKRDYPLMKQWVDYVFNQCEGSILWLNGFQRGDWLALDAPKSLPNLMSGGTDKNLVANVFYANSTEIVGKAAKELGYEEESKIYFDRFKAIVEEINEEYVTNRGRLVSETQTACALLLHFGYLKNEHVENVKKILKGNLLQHKNHLSTGFIGTPFLLQALSENGMHNIAEEVFFQQDYPGWFYAINKGATTIWERWDSIHEDGTFDESGMNSLNHYSYGAVGNWLYQKVLGISPLEPGYKKILLAPTLTRRMTEAAGYIDTGYGRLSLKWTCRDGIIEVNVEIPSNTTAVLRLPEKSDEIILGSGDFSYRYPTNTKLLIGKYTRSITYKEILSDEKAAQILYKVMPSMKDNPMIDFIKEKTLGQMEAMASGNTSKVDELLSALNAIEE